MSKFIESIDSKKLNDILQSRDMLLTAKEIRELMDAELEKEPEEMDTELIELCISALSDKQDSAEPAPTTPTVSKRITSRKLLLIAAVVALTTAVAIQIGSGVINQKQSQAKIEFASDSFRIDLRESDIESVDTSRDILSSVTADTLDTLLLPQALLNGEYEKALNFYSEEGIDALKIQLLTEGKEFAKITVQQYANSNSHNIGNELDFPDNNYNFKELIINGKTVMVFGNSAYSTIRYADNNLKYNIYLNSDYKTGCEIAETLNNEQEK